MPLPTLGISWHKSRIEWTPDERFDVPKNQNIQRKMERKSTRMLDNRNISSNLEQKNGQVDLYIAKFQDAFTGAENAEQSPIAQRNPRDFPQFLVALKNGDVPKAFQVLQRILRTDPIL